MVWPSISVVNRKAVRLWQTTVRTPAPVASLNNSIITLYALLSVCLVMVIELQMMVVPVIPMVITTLKAVILPAGHVIHGNSIAVGGNYHELPRH
jgi:hypothetical protein